MQTDTVCQKEFGFMATCAQLSNTKRKECLIGCHSESGCTNAEYFCVLGKTVNYEIFYT